MSEFEVTRRRFFGMGTSAVLLAGVPAGVIALPKNAAAEPKPGKLLGEVESLPPSLNHAFIFTNQMMDAYATGATVRLAQSYSDQALGATAFTYDNAVLIHAYLGSDDPDNLPRAEVLGKGLLYAQATNFPVNDGRFAQAYFVNVAASDGSGAFITPAAFPFYFYTSAVGDQAWAGMALAQLYARTHHESYLVGALKVANWIVANTYSTLGAGGYSFGTNINPLNQSVPSTNGKSTEHNIDTYAFFTMLVKLTDDGFAENGRSWRSLAEHAIKFLRSMFNEAGPYFYTGTLGDQVTTNTSPIPEDCQTWSYMALLDSGIDLPGRKKTIDWALNNLVTTDTAAAKDSSITGTESFTGLVFDTASLTTTADDPNAVWLEGTSHGAAALIARVLRGGDGISKLIDDITQALNLLEDCVHAQKLLGAGQTVGGKVIPVGLGLVASTSVMDTGFGYTYGPSLHIGATGWYLIAGHAANPFQLGYRVIG
jgi:hypothetical protein